jgi:negative regulator of flagellin synthesis FlgM
VQVRAFREEYMSNVSGINSTQSPRPIQPASTPKTAGPIASTSQTSDTVEISQQARVAAKLASLPEVRSDLVSRVKGEIQAGTYDTQDKLNTAIDRMLNEM